MVTRRSFLGGIAASAAFCAAPRVTWASVARPLSLGELLYESRYVVLGQATAAQARWEQVANRTSIITYSVFRVEESLGPRPPEASEVTIRSLGGTVGGKGQVFHGEAALAFHERAVVFLRDAGPGILAVAGMAQGYYPVRKDEKGVPRLCAAFSDVTFAGDGADNADAAMRRLNGRTVSDVESMLANEVPRAHT
jgi:hypothetical protein